MAEFSFRLFPLFTPLSLTHTHIHTVAFRPLRFCVLVCRFVLKFVQKIRIHLQGHNTRNGRESGKLTHTHSHMYRRANHKVHKTGQQQPLQQQQKRATSTNTFMQHSHLCKPLIRLFRIQKMALIIQLYSYMPLEALLGCHIFGHASCLPLSASCPARRPSPLLCPASCIPHPEWAQALSPHLCHPPRESLEAPATVINVLERNRRLEALPWHRRLTAHAFCLLPPASCPLSPANCHLATPSMPRRLLISL